MYVFSGRANRPLAQPWLTRLGLPLGGLLIDRFPIQKCTFKSRNWCARRTSTSFNPARTGQRPSGRAPPDR